MTLPSGSKIGLAIACQHPWTSGAAWPKEEDESRYAFGNAVHEWAEYYIAHGRDDALEIARSRGLHADDRRRLIATIVHMRARIDEWTDDGWLVVPEVAVAYDVARGTARQIPRVSHRDYSAVREGELAATLDVVAIKQGAVRLADWKSGRWISRDEVSWQLKFGALAIARCLGASDVDTALHYVGEETIYDDAATLDAFELDAAALELRALWPKLTNGPTPPQPGRHCVEAYCPLAGRCAATRAALAEVRASSVVRIATAEDAARVWALLPQAEAAIKAAKTQIREMASRQPIPLPNGKRLVVSEVTRETIDVTPSVVDLLPAEAIEYTTSKAAIERAVGKARAKEIIAELRKAGALRVSSYTNLKEIANDTEEKSA